MEFKMIFRAITLLVNVLATVESVNAAISNTTLSIVGNTTEADEVPLEHAKQKVNTTVSGEPPIQIILKVGKPGVVRGVKTSKEPTDSPQNRQQRPHDMIGKYRALFLVLGLAIVFLAVAPIAVIKCSRLIQYRTSSQGQYQKPTWSYFFTPKNDVSSAA